MRVRNCRAVPSGTDLSSSLALFPHLGLLVAIWLAVSGCSIPANAQDKPGPQGTLTAEDLFRTGQYAECIEVTTKSLAKNEFDESQRVLKLRAEMELGLYAEALATLDAGLKKVSYSIDLRWFGRDACRVNQQAERVEKFDQEIFELIKQAPWRYSDTAHQVTVGRWMLSQHADPKRVLTGIYNEAKKRAPESVAVQLAIGDLALEKFDYLLAGQAFQLAVKLSPEHPDAWFGVAQAFAPSDSKKAEEALKNALKFNEDHLPSLLMLVDDQIDSERYEDAAEVLTHISTINPQQPLALAYRAVLAHLHNLPELEKSHRAAALKPWPGNAAVDHLIGKKLSQKYRFAEGAQYQRQALELDPKFAAARTQLAQDLLRLGNEDEGLKLAEEVYAADAYNIFAHNLVTLQENLAKFRTLEADGFLLRMEAREAEIYGNRALDLLKRAKRTLCEKYDIKLEQPIVVELFPRQEDFAIRTFGLPGGAGFLGVCFGTVITANSPASQGNSPSNWEATLWHEFCHVVTLNKTHNRMPRWLSEGISVYEERQANATWGQQIVPRYREMILGDDLTPVSQLSGAFLSPKSALHLQFAYLESSLVVEYFIEKHGLETLKKVLVDLGEGMPINQALARTTGGSIEAIDTEFAEFARARAQAMAPMADWSKPELPKQATPEMVTAWLKDHPANYAGLRQLAELQIRAKLWPEATATLEAMLVLYPNDGAADSPYAMLARIYRALDNKPLERKMLEKQAALNPGDLELLDRLGTLCAEASDWEAVRKAALHSLAINPLLPEIHRRSATAAVHLQDHNLAVENYSALLLMQPFDPAEVHFQLAFTLRQKGDLAAAKRHVLLALEETPRFRAAQKLLLEIVDELAKEAKATGSDKPAEDAKPPADTKATLFEEFSEANGE